MKRKSGRPMTIKELRKRVKQDRKNNERTIKDDMPSYDDFPDVLGHPGRHGPGT